MASANEFGVLTIPKFDFSNSEFKTRAILNYPYLIHAKFLMFNVVETTIS